MKKILFAFIFLFAFHSAMVQAGEPIINVSDIDFGDVIRGKTSSKDITIINSGSEELIINSYKGPSDTVFKTVGIPNISVNNTLTIPPQSSYKFQVEFSPKFMMTYSDKIVFSSNAKSTDSIAFLNGRAKFLSLGASSYIWGRHRIDRPNFPSGPYLAPNGFNVRNIGNYEITIYGIEINSDINGDAFEFDRNMLTNLIVHPDGKAIFIPVQFHPTKVGKHELSFTYIDSEGGIAKTILEGIGILPKLETNNADFDSTFVQDYSNPRSSYQRIYFNNIKWADSDGTNVFDSLTIDFKIGPNGDEISTDGINWGTEGFRFDKSKIRHSTLGDNLTFPVVLYPGDSLEIVGAQFVAPNSIGIHQATITSVSDAYEDVISTWYGKGSDPTPVEEYENNENISRLLGYYDILGRRINSIEQYHGLYLEIRMEKNKVLKKIVYKD